MEHPSIAFTRKYCKSNFVRYQIKGSTNELWLYNMRTHKFQMVCYCLNNLTEEQIVDAINMYYSAI